MEDLNTRSRLLLEDSKILNKLNKALCSFESLQRAHMVSDKLEICDLVNKPGSSTDTVDYNIHKQTPSSQSGLETAVEGMGASDSH